MNRRLKRELTARILSTLAVALPIAISIVVAILVHTLLGWEGRAAAIVGVGAVFSVSALPIVLPIWEKYKDSGYYSYMEGKSFLRNWIEEEEVEPPKKKAPRAEAWKE